MGYWILWLSFQKVIETDTLLISCVQKFPEIFFWKLETEYLIKNGGGGAFAYP